MKTQLPYVSSEGGPIIIGDYNDLIHWNGSDLTLYNQACKVMGFALMPIEFSGKRGLFGDLVGRETAFLVKKGDAELVFIKYWSRPELSDSSLVELADVATESISSNSLAVMSGRVLIIWAAEDASKIVPPKTAFGRPKGLAIDGSGYFISLAVGNYKVDTSHYFKNEVEVAALRLRRLDDPMEGA